MAPEPRDDELLNKESDTITPQSQESTPAFEKRPLGGDSSGLPPYDPKDDPDAEPAVPAFTAGSAANTANSPQKKQGTSKKKGIIAGVLVALLIIVGGAFATYALWWNSPDKVLADAMRHTLMAERGTAVGSLKVFEEGATDTTLTFDMRVASQTRGQLDGNLSVKEDGQETDLNGSLVVDDQDLYVKLNNLRELIENGMGPNPFVALFDDLIEQVDGKWVAITADDIKELESSGVAPSDTVDDKQLECVQGVLEDFRTNEGEQQQVMNAYQDNMFVYVEETLGSETVAGRDSNHYLIGFDEQKGEAFGDALVQTDVFKQFDDCTDGELSQQVNDESSEPKGDSRVELWVDRWSHQPTKVLITDDTDGTKTTLEAVTDLTATPEVTVPEADTTITELMKELERIQQELFGSFMTPESQFEIQEVEPSGIGA